MRRTFPRTPGSPQASVTVETPAHRYADALVTEGLHFSEVVIGSVEPNMSLFLRTLQNYEIITIFSHVVIKKLSKSCVIQEKALFFINNNEQTETMHDR